jgi:hypothetical protein
LLNCEKSPDHLAHSARKGLGIAYRRIALIALP